MDTVQFAVVALVITSGLLAGFFFAWWCSCMNAFKDLSDPVFVETMQSVNRVLPNSRFILPFMAPVILSPICTWLLFANDQSTAAWWCVGATVLAIVTFGITAFGNVPLNNALEAAGSGDNSAARAAFETPWTRLNDIRTLTSFLTFCAAVAVLVALI